MITLAAGIALSTSRSSTRAMNATRSSACRGARSRIMRPSIAVAVPGATRSLMASATRRAVPKSVALSSKLHVRPLTQPHRHSALDRGACGNAPGRQMVDLHLASGGAGAGSADQHVALRHGIHLPVGAAQRREQQRAAAKRTRVAHRGHGDIELLSGPGKRRQRRRHHDRRDIAQLQAAARRQGDAELAEHGGEALHREGRLRRLVTAAVQADHESVADELIGAHALDASPGP